MKGITLVLFFLLSAALVQAAAVDTTISQSSDDAFIRLNGWPGYSHSAGNIYAGRIGSEPVYGGFRFTNLNIPENSIITAAYVNFTQNGWGWEIPTNLTFENAENPSTFSSTSTPFDRWSSKTSFNTQWTWPRSTPSSTIQSPSLVQGLQELVDTYGGIDAVVLIESGEPAASGEWHNWDSYDGNPSTAATLHVEYESGEDTVAPIVSNGQPSGTLPLDTTQTNISVETNEAATCRYENASGISFTDMTNVFSATASTIHATTINDLHNGESYTFYVKCGDEAGNNNTQDYVISFDVAAPDSTPPLLSSPSPTGTLPEGTTSVQLTLTTDETAECRYSTTPSVFENMTVFETTNDVSHQTAFTVTEDTAYTIYAGCQDLSSNINDSLSWQFTVPADSTAPVISNGAPSGLLPTTTTETSMSVETNEAATCRYDTLADTPYESLATIFTTTGSTSHSALISNLTPDTSYTYYVKCADEHNNSNSADYTISFSVAPEGPIEVVSAVASSADDAYDTSGSWPGYSHTASNVYSGKSGSTVLYGGFRFTNLDIPANALITAA